MKTKNVLFIAILLIFSGLGTDLMAQNALRALVKKCESAENVEVSVIRKKDKETMKLTESIVTIRIRSNKALVDEFIAAFEKDESDAYEVIYSKKEGKIVPQYFKFKDVTFSFNYYLDSRTSVLSYMSYNGQRADAEAKEKAAMNKEKAKLGESVTITMIENFTN